MVEVDREDAMAALGEPVGEQRRNGRLADAAFLVGQDESLHETPVIVEDPRQGSSRR
jgi:hypothetical protein